MTARTLIETVNSGDTLTQEELFPLFSRASLLVNDCVRLLLRENDYIQLAVVALGAEVASNLDRNKAIYRRSVDFVDGTVKDVPVDAEQREADFLCACMDLQASMLNNDKDRQLDVVLGLPLTRMVFEQFLKDWHTKAQAYQEAAQRSLRAHLEEDSEAASAADAECHYLEQDCRLDPRTAYGVVRYVSQRLSALHDIYDRVFTAYSRVILKQAKAQAVSEDHALDCFQNGSFGLIRAISSYDNVSNARFVGHARWWIRQSMLYFLKEDSNLIRVSSNTWQHYAKLEAIRLKQESQTGPLSTEELSRASGYSASHVDAIYSTVRTSQVRSLDYPLKPDGSTPAISTLVESTEDQEDPLNYDPSDSVKVLLESLPDNLRNLVCLAYGLTEYVSQELDPVKVEAERLRQVSAL
jgi:RNA polymerase sigma factor (sigma-70 family)